MQFQIPRIDLFSFDMHSQSLGRSNQTQSHSHMVKLDFMSVVKDSEHLYLIKNHYTTAKFALSFDFPEIE